MFLRRFKPTLSTFLHLRIMFSLFLLPVFLFALSQVDQVDTRSAWLSFFIWHFLVYPASNGYNSYFDKDKGSIALIENPREVDKSLYYFSIFLDLIALILSLFLGWLLFFAVLIYGTFSKMYSHPSIRLKKNPIISFLVVFILQGGFIFLTNYMVLGKQPFSVEIEPGLFVAALICSLLIGASYPLTQVYQHLEDRERGDITLSMLIGVKGSFWFAGTLFLFAVISSYIFWREEGSLFKFWLFLFCLVPVGIVFVNWYLKVLKDEREANYRNMSRMTLLSSMMMLLYFSLLNFI